MRNALWIAAATLIVALAASPALADSHFDIAPYFENGQLLTGGLDHSGTHVAPPVSVYGYEFGEDEYDPFNPSDPGVNQSAGTGNLPAGAVVRYNILSSLLYWDGTGEVSLGDPGDAYMTLLIGTALRALTGDSGAQGGSLVQSVTADGVVHKHFTASLYANDTAGNIPGESDYVAAPLGIYAFSIELTLTVGTTTYTSDPIWIVFNNGMDETVHDAAMASLVPEPASLALLLAGGAALVRRRIASPKASRAN